MEQTQLVRAHFLVSGIVQGVFYRKNTDIRARDLQLVGWVRNLADGRVECVAEGPKQQLEALHEWMKIGPRHARVSAVEVEWKDATGEFTSFSIRY